MVMFLLVSQIKWGGRGGLYCNSQIELLLLLLYFRIIWDTNQVLNSQNCKLAISSVRGNIIIAFLKVSRSPGVLNLLTHL